MILREINEGGGGGREERGAGGREEREARFAVYGDGSVVEEGRQAVGVGVENIKEVDGPGSSGQGVSPKEKIEDDPTEALLSEIKKGWKKLPRDNRFLAEWEDIRGLLLANEGHYLNLVRNFPHGGRGVFYGISKKGNPVFYSGRTVVFRGNSPRETEEEIEGTEFTLKSPLDIGVLRDIERATGKPFVQTLDAKGKIMVYVGQGPKGEGFIRVLESVNYASDVAQWREVDVPGKNLPNIGAVIWLEVR